MSASFATRGLLLTEHEFSVPLDHSAPDGERITVFAREVADSDGRDRPMLVFLQGGPGSEAPRPTRYPSSPGWLDRALHEFRVLMLDQRGTGRSSPIGTLPGLTGREQAQRLVHFRADAIVRDAEHIRHELGIEQWSLLGQSFGGLCVMTYLSMVPEGVREAFVTGGLARRAAHRRRLPRTYARTLERGRRTTALPRRPRARPRAAPASGGRGRPPALGRPADGAAPATARRHAGHERRRRGAALHPRAARRLARLPPRRRGGARLRAQPALRRAPRGVLGRRRLDAVGGAAPAALRLRGRARALLRRARLPVDVRGLRRAGPAARGRGPPRRARVAAALRPRAPGRQRGARRRRDLRGGHVRSPRRTPGAARSSSGRPGRLRG